MTLSTTVTVELGDLEFECGLDVSPIIPGRFSGPPEDCYPDEGGDVDFTGAWLIEPSGSNWKRCRDATAEELKLLEPLAIDAVDLAEVINDEADAAAEAKAEARLDAILWRLGSLI